MATKGENKKQKKISAPKARLVARKSKGRFTIRSIAGSHSKETSVPLGFVVRELLGIAKNMHEVKALLNSGAVTVNGKPAKDYRLAIGLFDIIGITKKAYRIVFDSKGRLVPKEIEVKGVMVKLCRVAGKRTAKRGQMQISTSDGYTFTEKKINVKVGDTVKVELPQMKIAARLEMKEGNLAYVISGRHIGRGPKITAILPGTMRRPKLVELKDGSGTFITLEKNIMVIGEKKPEIEIAGQRLK